MTTALPFLIINAFTDDSFGGNPAIVVFLQHELPTETLQKISNNFNQPITVFIRAVEVVSPEPKSATFGIRWFTTELEAPLCGHGTLAATKAIFSTPGLVSSDVEEIRFQTLTRGIVTARKVDNDRIGIQLQTTVVAEVQPSVREEVEEAVNRAFGRQVSINFVGGGGKGFESYLLIELDEKEDLAGSKVIGQPMVATLPYIVNVFTTSSSDPDIAFVSRMFAPTAGVDEDHVCGTAHCLLVPYWAKKKVLHDEIHAKQVSVRGGDLWIEAKDNVLMLKGELKVTAKGEIFV